jgi:hypothetical protein
MAPASCAYLIFVEKEQLPRESKAILPARLPAGSGAQT